MVYQNATKTVNEVDVITQERLLLAKICTQILKDSFEIENDSFILFSSLILLDNFFQNILPVSTFPNEIFKLQNGSSGLNTASKLIRSDIPDLETVENLETIPEVTCLINSNSSK